MAERTLSNGMLGRCLTFSHDVGFGKGTTEWAVNWKKRYTLRNAFIIIEFKKGIR
jgi:hypothetical protein